jgi:hypothetical protein
MKKMIFFVVLLFAANALAVEPPAPTFKNITSQEIKKGDKKKPSKVLTAEQKKLLSELLAACK